MSKLILISLLFFALPNTAWAATAVLKPPNNLGLVGYWPMNEATSTIAGDFSGNGYGGTLSGATIPSWIMGKLGQALNFNGSTSYIDVGTTPSALNLTGDLTVSAWIKPNSAGEGNFGRIIDSMNTGSNGIAFEINASNGLGFQQVVNSNTNILTFGQWQHVVVTLSGTTVTFYVNGASAGSGTQSPPASTAENFVIGNRMAGDRTFDGGLDDVRIYSRALSASEVLALYKSAATRSVSSSKTLTRGSSLEVGLVGLWTFDGGDVNWTSDTAGFVYDRSGNNNTGTLTSMTRTGSVAIGKLGQGMLFDGSASYVDIPSLNNTITYSAMTIAGWFYLSGAQVGNPRFVANSHTDQDHLGFQLHLGSNDCLDAGSLILFDVGNGTSFACANSGITISNGQWYHIVGVYNGSTASIYVNGTLAGTPANLSGTIGASAVDLNIGRNPSYAGDYLKGLADDVRLYNRALSATEVKQLYLLGQTKIKP